MLPLVKIIWVLLMQRALYKHLSKWQHNLQQVAQIPLNLQNLLRAIKKVSLTHTMVQKNTKMIERMISSKLKRIVCRMWKEWKYLLEQQVEIRRIWLRNKMGPTLSMISTGNWNNLMKVEVYIRKRRKNTKPNQFSDREWKPIARSIISLNLKLMLQKLEKKTYCSIRKQRMR